MDEAPTAEAHEDGDYVTLFDRMVDMGLSHGVIEKKLREGAVRLDDVVVTNPNAPAARPARITFYG